MFTFDDLVKLDAGSAQDPDAPRRQGQARHRFEERQRGCPRLLPRQHVVPRRKMLLDDMAALGPVRLRDVDEAQALLVNLAKDSRPRARSC